MKRTDLIAAFFLLSLALIIINEQQNFFTMLIKSFAFQIMCIIFLLSIYWIWKSRWHLSLAAFCSLLLIDSILPPLYSRDSVRAPSSNSFSIAHFNVLISNTEYESTIAAAINSKADFISFNEVTQAWADSLDRGLSGIYSYSKVVPNDESSFGIAVYSKYPLSDLKILCIEDIPNITGRIKLTDTSLYFITSHTKSPISNKNYKIRNRHIHAIANHLKTIEGPVVAAGDYNIVPWDSVINTFKKKAALVDSRQSLTPTYPAYLKIAQIPIDYIFHSDELDCLSFSTISGTSSDHLSIIGYYQFKNL